MNPMCGLRKEEEEEAILLVLLYLFAMLLWEDLETDIPFFGALLNTIPVGSCVMAEAMG